jgi:hypothetical protein
MSLAAIRRCRGGRAGASGGSDQPWLIVYNNPSGPESIGVQHGHLDPAEATLIHSAIVLVLALREMLR